MKPRKLILVAGMPGSGKSLISQVARDMGIQVFTMGDVIRQEVKRRGMEPTPANLNLVARELRRMYGPRVVAERILEEIKKSSCDMILIDGVRSLDEVEVFRSYVPSVVIVAVHASPRTRFERLRARGRAGDPRTWEEFTARDMMELGFGLGSVIALADYMFVNEGIDVEEARRLARKLLEAVIRGETWNAHGTCDAEG